MKNIIILILMLTSFSPAEQQQDWKALNAGSQNLARKLTAKKAYQDTNTFEPEVSKIDRSLDALVKSGHLVKKVFNFEFKGDLDDFLNKLSQNDDLNKIVEEYGVYTAMEMMGISRYLRGDEFPTDGKVTLKVHLPRNQMDIFTKSINQVSSGK
jgi:hypothetical protein